MSTPVVIIGAGGFGREVLGVVRDEGSHEFLGFLDDGEPDLEILERLDAPFLGGTAQIAELGAHYLIGIGSPQARRAIDIAASEWGVSAASVRHATSTWQATTVGGPGLVVCSSVSITTNVRLGRHVHVNLNATIGHDCEIGDYVTINPGANISGAVRLGDDVTIGTGAAIIQGITVGAGAIVGAGAVVVRDVDPGATVVGSPARPIQR